MLCVIYCIHGWTNNPGYRYVIICGRCFKPVATKIQFRTLTCLLEFSDVWNSAPNVCDQCLAFMEFSLGDHPPVFAQFCRPKRACFHVVYIYDFLFTAILWFVVCWFSSQCSIRLIFRRRFPIREWNKYFSSSNWWQCHSVDKLLWPNNNFRSPRRQTDP